MELKGLNIVITRSPSQAQSFKEKIEKLGGNALLFPTLITQETDKTDKRNYALKNIAHYQWIIFNSENAVRYFWKETRDYFFTSYKNQVAAVGEKTAKILQKLGIKVNLIPLNFSAEGLLKVLEKEDVTGKEILLPVSNLTHPELADGLRALGAKVHAVEFYQTIPNPNFDAVRLKFLIQHRNVHVITHFSPSSFKFLIDLMGPSTIDLLKKNNVALAAIGPSTAKAIHRAGLTVDIQPEKSTMEYMIQAIIKYFENKNNE